MDPAHVEKTLLERELPRPLPGDEKWIAPAYDGLSIANLAATIAGLLDLGMPDALPALPRALQEGWAGGLQRVVLVIVDGLGYQFLLQRLAAGDGRPLAALAEVGRMVPLTSVFPSTTDAALHSIFTGTAPATHGWLAWELYLREIGVAANAVLLCPIWSNQRDLLIEWGLQPELLLRVPTLAMNLRAAGVTTAALTHRGFVGSGFTRMLYRGVGQVRGHHHASDFWVQLRHQLHETRGQRAFITAYWGGMDTVGHAYGPQSEEAEAEFRSLSHALWAEFLRRLPARDRDGVLFLLTADHGQIHVPHSHILTADQDARLSRDLQVPVMGESRAAFLYPRSGRAAAIRSYLEDAFPDWFRVLSSEEVLEGGLFGSPIADETAARAGELLVLPRGDRALQRSRPRSPLVGRHGGLTAQEMLVPLIGVRLEALSH